MCLVGDVVDYVLACALPGFNLQHQKTPKQNQKQTL